MENCIIYALKDPRTDEYKYVGKSVQGLKRPQSHLNHSHNPLVNEWVKELKMDNYIPDIVILEEVSNWTELADKEKYWIGKLINDDYDLFNVLILDSYNNTINFYNEKLKEQIKKREEFLQNKLTKIIAKGGNILDISDIIIKRRKMLNVTQETLAEISSVGLSTIKRIELGKINTSLSTMSKILDCLGLELFVTIK